MIVRPPGIAIPGSTREVRPANFGSNLSPVVRGARRFNPGRTPLRLFAALWAVVFVLFPALAWAAPIRVWHAYRGDEEKALLEILSMWKGEPIDTLAVPFDAYAAKLQAAIPLGDGPDLFIDAHERMGTRGVRRKVRMFFVAKPMSTL